MVSEYLAYCDQDDYKEQENPDLYTLVFFWFTHGWLSYEDGPTIIKFRIITIVGEFRL